MVKLKGTAGNDVLGGLASDDRIAGLAGNDTLIGAGGFDTLDYSASPAAVTVNFLTGKALDGYGNVDTISGFEEVNGSRYADVIVLGNGIFESAFGHAGSDKLYGNAGEDWLRPGSGYDYVDGGSGNDTVSYFAYAGVPDLPQSRGIAVNLELGTAIDAWGNADQLMSIENVESSILDDRIVGSSASNQFIMRGGSNYVDGGGGVDEIVYRKVSNPVVVNLNNGIALTGGGERDTLGDIENVRGSSYNDTIIGNRYNNRIDGGLGNDSIYGEDGKNVLIGGEGNDRIFSGANADYIDGGPGTDTVYYIRALHGIAANLTLHQAKSGLDSDSLFNIENVFGSNYKDVLTGDARNNMIWAAKGDDFINGGGGNDYIDGGPGIDTVFYAGSRSDYVVSRAGADVVVRDGVSSNGDYGVDTLHDVEQVLIGGQIYGVSDLIF
ncbi:MAG: calcium-binding protein [Geminicoccaceae bacterium]